MRNQKRFLLKQAPFLLITLLLAFSMIPGLSLALEVVQPTENFYIADYANVLEQATEEYIITQNNALYTQTGAQICVVTVEFIGSADIEDHAYTLANNWGIGSSEKNNGFLLLMVIVKWCLIGM